MLISLTNKNLQPRASGNKIELIAGLQGNSFHMKTDIENSDSHRRLQVFLKWMIFYTLLVILWGAWVRISHSGDGCGQSWPLCKGEFIPETTHKKTWVEYAHRLMSGSFGLFIIGIFLYIRRAFPDSHPIRRWAKLSLIFMITEALLGAKLVLFKLVGSDDSPLRSFAMSLHLINSLMLTGSIFLTYDFSKYALWKKRLESPWLSSSLNPRRLATGLLLSFTIIGISGAIAALANTLFPSDSIWGGLQADVSSDSHYLVRMRGIHPLLGILFGGSIVLTAYLSTLMQKPSEIEFKIRSQVLASIAVLGICAGIATLFLLAPIYLKLTHLLLAHCIWLCIVAWVRELRWIPENPLSLQKAILFFDGVCNLCNSMVDFSIKRLANTQSNKFASLQGSTAKDLLSEYARNSLETVIYFRGKKSFHRSDAIIELLYVLKYPYPLLAIFMMLIPKLLRDGIYRIVAKFRYPLFGQRPSCRLPNNEERSLFLD